MPAIRQKVRAIAALALVGIAVLLTWRFLPRERLLLARATYVLTVHNPFDPLAGIGGPARRAPAARPALLLYDPYFWKSDKEILTFRPAAGSPLLYEAYCVHLDTGRQDSMPAFNRMLASEMGANALFRGPAGSRFVAIWAHETLQLSPDGHWMLCRYWDLPSARAGQAVISLDGSRRLFWAGSPDDPFLPGRLSPCWLPDSRRWIVIQNTMQNGTEFECTVQIYDLRAPHTVITRKVTLPSDPHYLQMLGITQ
ncbi:MAG TPA: hypothetical protein VKT32_09600, partial [Chthonomonadaceae bacterium]|nr:hypothetical protein [Chthonomonadaceae bacterium]